MTARPCDLCGSAMQRTRTAAEVWRCSCGRELTAIEPGMMRRADGSAFAVACWVGTGGETTV